mgnify:CR=1 FL=1
MKLSICIPTYNRPKHLPNCLNSIYLAQQEYRSNNGEYCTNDCNSQSKIITELFDGVDDLSDQNYQFKVNNRSDGFEAEAKHKTSNCTIKLNRKEIIK